MKAIVYTAPGEFKYTDTPEPVPQADEVLIKVRACGLCRTDMHIHLGHFLSEFPLTPGHEISGEIVWAGEKVESFKIGDRVVADNTELCGHCRYCRENAPLFCENFVSHGCNCAGGFAEYVAIKAEKTFKVHRLSFIEAVMTEPLACAIHGMDVIALSPGSEVLMFGAGPTGLLLAQLLKLNGAVNLVVAAPAGPKLELAKKLAADDTVAIDKQDYSSHKKYIQEHYPNGFDVVVEATGVPKLLEESIRFAEIGGQIITYGVYPEDEKVQINPYEIFRRELTLKGSFAQTHCFGRALRYLESHQVKVSDMITHQVPLQHFDEALDLMRRSDAIKIAIIPAG